MIVLLSLTAGCSVTDSTPVKLGLLSLAGFILYSVASKSGSSSAIRVILITVGLVVLIPVAVVVFLLAVCFIDPKAFGLTAPAPPISSAHIGSHR